MMIRSAKKPCSLQGGASFSAFILIVSLLQVAGHGRLIDPPSRGTAWRYNFNVPHDYNDNEGNCGGNWAKGCGICGDDLSLPQPRPHEAGGRYGTGIVVAHYKKGQFIDIKVELTKNHMGYFLFKVCPNDNPDKDPDQECFDRTVLKASWHDVRYILPDSEDRTYDIRIKLPRNVTCEHCILQWTYTAGNSVGRDADGKVCLGCGPQEIFRACADIAITPKGGSLEEVNLRHGRDFKRPQGQFLPSGKVARGTRCVPAGVWFGRPGMQQWCDNNCGHYRGDCPPTHCDCS